MMLASNPSARFPGSIASTPAPSYDALVQAEMRFTPLLKNAAVELGSGVVAHPAHLIQDPVFVGLITRHVEQAAAGRSPAPHEMDALRSAAIHEFVRADRNGELPETFSGKVLKLVGECFPHGELAPMSYGRAYFETMLGNRVIPTFDKNGGLASSYELLNTYVFTKGRDPIAIGGLYAMKGEDGAYALWGGRIAIDPQFRGTRVFGHIVGQLGADATEAIRLTAASEMPALSKSFYVFTTKSAENAGVINLYSALGIEDTGREMTYNGIKAMIMRLPDLLDEGVQRRIQRMRGVR